jgi:hypothetical protein
MEIPRMKQTVIHPEVAENSLLLQHSTIVRIKTKKAFLQEVILGKKLITGEL